MNSASFNQWATVTDAWYKANEFSSADEFIVVLDTGEREQQVSVVNGRFTRENPTLALLAYAGAKPSTIEDDFVGSVLPVQQAPTNFSETSSGSARDSSESLATGTAVQIPQQVFGNGQMILKESVWGPQQ